jgi:hypothetical protein
MRLVGGRPLAKRGLLVMSSRHYGPMIEPIRSIALELPFPVRQGAERSYASQIVTVPISI